MKTRYVGVCFLAAMIAILAYNKAVAQAPLPGPIVASSSSGGGSGITTLNTLTGATQTFAFDTAAAFGATSSGTTHTFHFPTVLTPTTLSVGSGTTITKILKGNFTANITGATVGSAPTETSVTITGAAVGDAISIGPRILLTSGGGPTNAAVLFYYISGADTIKMSLISFVGGAGAFGACNAGCTFDYVLYK